MLCNMSFLQNLEMKLGVAVEDIIPALWELKGAMEENCKFKTNEGHIINPGPAWAT